MSPSPQGHSGFEDVQPPVEDPNDPSPGPSQQRPTMGSSRSAPIINLQTALQEVLPPDRYRTHAETTEDGIQTSAQYSGSGSPEAIRHHGHHHHRHTSIFDLAHSRGKRSEHLQHHISIFSEQEPIRLYHLFKRPVIRQWLYGGHFWREKDDRLASRFELFFDLLFVGLTHLLAEGLEKAGEATGMNLAIFIFCYWGAFNTWTDTRSLLNRSGTDDVLQRLYLLTVMILLVGYTANATGITIIHEVPRDGEATASMPGLQDRYVRPWRRSDEEDEGLPERRIGHSSYWFTEGYHTAISGAVAFYLVAKFLKLLITLTYGILLPRFRLALIVELIPSTISACVYMPLLWVEEPHTILATVITAVTLEILSKYWTTILMQFVNGQMKRRGQDIFIPAQSPEHLSERTVLFVVLVLGEGVLNSCFRANVNDYGLSHELGRSALSVMSFFWIAWVYFDCDASRVFLHALRRNAFASITFTLLHFPLCASLILVSSALPRLIKEDESEAGYCWFYGAGLATTMVCIALAGLLHKNLDLHRSAVWPRIARLMLRGAAAAAFAIVPVKSTWSNTTFLGFYTGLLALLVISETFGKLGVVGRHFDEARAEQYYRQLKGERPSAPGGSVQDDVALGRLHDEESIRLPKGPITSMEQPSPLSIEPSQVPLPPSKQSTGETSQTNLHRQPSRGDISVLLRSTREVLNPYTSAVRLDRRSSWHPYEDLTEDEAGRADVGIEAEVGQIEAKKRMDPGQRWALVAN